MVQATGVFQLTKTSFSQFIGVVASSIATVVCFSFLDLSLIESETGAKAFYAWATCSLFLFIPTSYSGFPPATNKTFGVKYFSTAYGMVMTCCVSYYSFFKAWRACGGLIG